MSLLEMAHALKLNSGSDTLWTAISCFLARPSQKWKTTKSPTAHTARRYSRKKGVASLFPAIRSGNSNLFTDQAIVLNGCSCWHEQEPLIASHEKKQTSWAGYDLILVLVLLLMFTRMSGMLRYFSRFVTS